MSALPCISHKSLVDSSSLVLSGARHGACPSPVSAPPLCALLRSCEHRQRCSLTAWPDSLRKPSVSFEGTIVIAAQFLVAKGLICFVFLLEPAFLVNYIFLNCIHFYPCFWHCRHTATGSPGLRGALWGASSLGKPGSMPHGTLNIHPAQCLSISKYTKLFILTFNWIKLWSKNVMVDG